MGKPIKGFALISHGKGKIENVFLKASKFIDTTKVREANVE